MDYYALEEAHKGIIYLFLAQLTFKVVLMVTSKPIFDKIQPKAKILDIILGPLIVISGVMIIHELDWTIQYWLVVKIVLVIVAIGLAIIGLRKGNVILAGLSLLIFISIFVFMSTGRHHSMSINTPIDSQQTISQQINYSQFQ